MTDAAYQAKEWLERLEELYMQAEKIEREISIMEDHINNAVGNYEYTGRGHTDLIVRQQQREDALLEYSAKKAKYEREYLKFVKEEIITLKVLDRMKNREHAVLLINRYINRLSWEKISNRKRYNPLTAQTQKKHVMALEELSTLLKTEEPRAIQEAESYIRNYYKKASA